MEEKRFWSTLRGNSQPKTSQRVAEGDGVPTSRSRRRETESRGGDGNGDVGDLDNFKGFAFVELTEREVEA
jgi:hypothetical protein